jgi:hypothetical protein
MWCDIRLLISSGEVVVNPGLKSDRDRGRCLTALQGKVAGADQMAHRAVVNPNRQAPQPHSGPRAVRLHPLRSRRLETRYIWWVAIGNALPSVVADPSFEVDSSIIRLG